MPVSYTHLDVYKRQHIYRYVPKTGGFEMLPLEEDVITSFTLANDNPVVAAYVGGGKDVYKRQPLYPPHV